MINHMMQMVTFDEFIVPGFESNRYDVDRNPFGLLFNDNF